jgi:hypothetical protein
MSLLGSFSTDAFSARADQCPLLLQSDVIVRRSEVTLRADFVVKVAVGLARIA